MSPLSPRPAPAHQVCLQGQGTARNAGSLLLFLEIPHRNLTGDGICLPKTWRILLLTNQALKSRFPY